MKYAIPLSPEEFMTEETLPTLQVLGLHLRIVMVVIDMLLELRQSFAFLLADPARVTSIFLNFDEITTFPPAIFQMSLGFPSRFIPLVTLRALLVFGCIQLRIFSALLSQHFLKFLVRVCLIRLF